MSDTYIEPQEQMKIIEALQLVAQKSKQYTNKKIEQIELIPGPEGPQGPKGDPGDTPELADWVLAPEKPEYTAEEVGALSMDATTSLLEDYTTKNYVSQQITDALSKNFLIQIVTWEADD